MWFNTPWDFGFVHPYLDWQSLEIIQEAIGLTGELVIRTLAEVEIYQALEEL